MEENTSRVYVGTSAGLLTDPALANSASAAGNPLFVINLCASIAPIQAAGKTIPGFESYKLYQVARNEDGRTRHRLRLGFFTSEADAEDVLASVRDNYPTAFVTSLSDEDRRHTRGYVPTARSKPAISVVPSPAPAPQATPSAASAAKPAASTAAKSEPVAGNAAAKQPAPAATSQKPAPSNPAPQATPVSSKPEAAKPTAVDEIELSWDPPALSSPQSGDTSASARTVAPSFKTDTVIKARPAEPAKAKAQQPAKPKTPEPIIELTLENDVAPIAKTESHKPASEPAQPFHVGKGVDIPTVALTLEPSAPATPAKPAASAPAKTAAAPTAKPAAKPAAAKAAPPKPAQPAAAAPRPSAPVPSSVNKPAMPAAPSAGRVELDSTQTIRALTSAEMNDDEKWFSIQLVVSEQPVNLDAMPHLDIFEAYRVYSIANAGSGKIVYSLRLGFFREEVSAEAVAGYLKTFFASPSVMRISTAEQLRFKDAPAPKATAAASAKGEAKVIELNQARDRKPTIPTVTMEVDTSATGSFRPNATGSFRPNATGSFKVNASGTHKALTAAKAAPPATRRSAPLARTSSTGKHKALQTKKSLQEQLLDEAREVQLSESAIRKLPKNDSLLSRLVGKLTK